MVRKIDLIYKDESYKIVGLCFNVYNQIGSGHKEFTYQKAVEKLLRLNNIHYKSQQYLPVRINDELIGKYYIDLVIEEKIAIEFKVGELFRKRDIEQLVKYLKAGGLKLGLLVNYSTSGVKFRRIVNLL